MSLVFQITSAGRTALVNASHNGTNAVQIASCGLSATPVVASAAATTLPGEFKRIETMSGAAVAPDIIHVVVRDESSDAYTARSIALYLTDGTLFGLYGQPDPIINKAAAAIGLIAIDLTLADIAADTISFGNANFLNPPATTTVAGIVRLSTQAEVDAGVSTGSAVTPSRLASRLAAVIAGLMASIATTVADYIPLAQKAQPGGVATLDNLGKVPKAQLSLGAADVGAIAAGARGAPNGVASLDGNSLVPKAQISLGAADVGAIAAGARGAPNGVASLDGNSLVPKAQISLGAADVGAIATGARGAPNGVASLDGNSLVPKAQLSLSAGDVGAIATGARGAANGVASLDGNGNVPAAQLTLALLPFGTITLFYGNVAPTGWAICNGGYVQRSDGSGLFQTPDLRGRVAVGVSDYHALGEQFGVTSQAVQTDDVYSGATVYAPLRTGVAGGGSGTAVNSVNLIDATHHHVVTVDVTQPSLALLYIIKV